jgi:hypothetical protein
MEFVIMTRYRKALVPLVMAGLVALADVMGIAPELITPEVAEAVIAVLLAATAGVYQVANKE